MTRDELIDKLEDILCTWEGDPCERYNCAISIMNTIFDALKEPTEQMISDGDDIINYMILKSESIYRAMLNASPLAPS